MYVLKRYSLHFIILKSLVSRSLILLEHNEGDLDFPGFRVKIQLLPLKIQHRKPMYELKSLKISFTFVSRGISGLQIIYDALNQRCRHGLTFYAVKLNLYNSRDLSKY